MTKIVSPVEETPNLRTAAYERFLDALRSGVLALGQMVSQKTLANDLGLSVGTLRELLPRLEAEGLIQVLNQRGILLPAIDLTMIRETFQLRSALEREAVLSAVETMPAQDIEALRRRTCEVLKAVEETPSEEALEEAEAWDREMHELLIAATGNRLLERTYATNTTRMRLIKLYRHALTLETTRDALNDHLAVVDAIAKRDRIGAMVAIERHIQNARDRAVKL